MTEVRDLMEMLCECAELYGGENGLPPHMIVYLDSGDERWLVADHIAETMEDFGIRDFRGMEYCLSYTIHGTLEELNRIECDIRRKAVYTNAFRGVIALEGLETISGHRDERQYERFLEIVKETGKEATLVFFAETDPDRNMKVLLERLKEELEDVVSVCVDQDTCDGWRLEEMYYEG